VDLDSLKSGEFGSLKRGSHTWVFLLRFGNTLRTTQLYGGHPLQQNVPNKTC
jgi:hypothetical protein